MKNQVQERQDLERKTKKKTLLISLFVAGFVLMMGLFALGLKNDPNQLDLVVKGEKIPAFSLPSLLTEETITHADLTSDKPYYLVNFWGSWCPSCYQEHPFLMQLARTETIYGVNWKDTRQQANEMLRAGGNPFKAIIVDDQSKMAIGFGVYGAPETYLVSKDGIILFRHAGPMSEQVWRELFMPHIEALEKAK